MIQNKLCFWTMGVTALFAVACQKDSGFNNQNEDAYKVEVNHISPEMAKVRDYVPPMAVMGHRGTVYWAPEETEASFRWAREEGVDYLESDLQMSMDGVILANHDEDLKRTTDIEKVYGEYVPQTRKAFYMRHGLTQEQAEIQYKKDVASFRPFYTKYYMYEELLALNAGSYFNETNLECARKGFVDTHLYISTLEDQAMYAKGKMLKRDDKGERIYKVEGNYTWDDKAKKITNQFDALHYTFEYKDDPQWSGNQPGIYIEFKESWLNPSDFVKRVYKELDRIGWNIITKPATDGNTWYKGGKVNVANTNGKVILQTFSLDALKKTADEFKGQIPMCWLGWTGTYATDLKLLNPLGYASWLNLGLENKAHIFGPSIAGAPNNYPEMDAPWMAYLIKKSGMLNHPYSFDTYPQMCKYFGEYNLGNDDRTFSDFLTFKKFDGNTAYGVYLDGLFTNRAELTIRYMSEKGFRNPEAPKPLDITPEELLTKLGY